MRTQTREILFKMLNVDSIEQVNRDLLLRIERVDTLCQKAEGDLISREVLATIVEEFERE